ncbi:hypothetical protein [Glaciecola sp. SC05]|uniref:hypothetical protein n=1 Tax=Glaciecola sp. SC05 TaxID=1987355 RepID=UPI003527A835
MTKNLIGNYTRNCGALFLFTAALLLQLTAFQLQAFQDQVGQQEQSAAVNENDTEVIDVVGEQHLVFYRDNLHEAEDAFFGMLNEVIEDDDFKVTCKTQLIQAFSRLKERTCEANFVSRITGRETRDGIDSGNQPSTMKIRRQLDKKQREYAEVLVAKINENPNILRAYQELELAKQKYQAAKGD